MEELNSRMSALSLNTNSTESLMARIARLPVDIIRLILAMHTYTGEAREAIAREARETNAAATIYNKLTYGRRGQRRFGNGNRRLGYGVSNCDYFSVRVRSALQNYGYLERGRPFGAPFGPLRRSDTWARWPPRS
jgi:hypothetical protein